MTSLLVQPESADDLHMAYQQMTRYAEDLQSTVQQLKAFQEKLEGAYIDTIHRLAMAVEYKDEETGHHVSRISYYSAILANGMNLSKENITRIFHAAPMHDVGKISIPDAILLKPDKLTPEEFTIIKTHTTAGAQILANSQSEFLETARIIALTHHEKWDGSGYPSGLSGENIPLEGRIVGLADVFDALLSRRHYKPPYDLDTALSIIEENRGSHFDPAVLDVFFGNLATIIEVTQRLNNEERPPLEEVLAS